MPNIRRSGFISVKSMFYKRFYNLDKIYRLNYLIISRVYRR